MYLFIDIDYREGAVGCIYFLFLEISICLRESKTD